MLDDTINGFGQPIGPTVSAWRPPGWPGNVALQGQYCRLEPLEAGRHAESLWKVWQLPDPGIPEDRMGEARWTYLGGRPFDDIAGCREWLRQRSLSEDPAFMCVIEKRSGDALGVASWLNIVPEHGSVELGHLNFSVRLSRTPVATEALMLMMQHAFALGYRRLEWKCDALNAASRRRGVRRNGLASGLKACFVSIA